MHISWVITLGSSPIQLSYYVIAELLGADGTELGPESQKLKEALRLGLGCYFFYRDILPNINSLLHSVVLKPLPTRFTCLLVLAKFLFVNYTLTDPRLAQNDWSKQQ